MTEQTPQDDAFNTNLSVGEILRRSRLTYNITFEQAERDLRIKAGIVADFLQTRRHIDEDHRQ